MGLSRFWLTADKKSPSNPHDIFHDSKGGKREVSADSATCLRQWEEDLSNYATKSSDMVELFLNHWPDTFQYGALGRCSKVIHGWVPIYRRHLCKQAAALKVLAKTFSPPRIAAIFVWLSPLLIVSLFAGIITESRQFTDKTVHRKGFLKTVHRQNWRQFTDT